MSKLQKLNITVDQVKKGLKFCLNLSKEFTQPETFIKKAFTDNNFDIYDTYYHPDYLLEKVFSTKHHHFAITLSGTMFFIDNLISKNVQIHVIKYLNERYGSLISFTDLLPAIWICRYIRSFLDIVLFMELFDMKKDSWNDKYLLEPIEKFILSLSDDKINKLINWCNNKRIKFTMDFEEGNILENLY